MNNPRIDELKTLKDLKEMNFKSSGYSRLVFKEDLKAEAVKRIKFIKELFLDGFKLLELTPTTPREAYFHQLGKFQELKRFLDITEDDLK